MVRKKRFCLGKFRAVQYFFLTIARVGVPRHALPFMRLCSDHRDNSIVQTPHPEPRPFGIGVSTDDLVRSARVKCRGSGTCLPKDAAAYDIKFMDQSLRVLMALRGV
jgi:hypothetical protein